MRSIIVEAEVFLDCVTGGDNPDFWGRVFKHHADDVTKYLADLLAAPEALLMGRKTYEVFAQVWPFRSGNDADRINAMPKYVASRSSKGALAWNATLLEGDATEAIRKLKAEPGRDLLQYGVGELTKTMFEHGLVDELRLVVYPFVFGRGERLFENFDTTSLELVETKTFSTGAVALHHRPARN